MRVIWRFRERDFASIEFAFEERWFGIVKEIVCIVWFVFGGLSIASFGRG